MTTLTRRVLLRSGAAASVPIAALSQWRPTAAATRLRRNPFTLGVASGEPYADGFVIWTRLAVSPLEPDGLGGMGATRRTVHFQVATDPGFTRVVKYGDVLTSANWGHAVHITLRGLRPGREYWYRFRSGGWMSETGRTRTAPDPTSFPSLLSMAVVSCSAFPQGYFTAYRRLAEDHPDLVLHLGDYIYEYGGDGIGRHHIGPECTTLANYRQRYAQYRTDADLRAAHAVAPWLPVWDDHEVENGYADDMPEKPAERSTFLARRQAAYKAYYENMPLRRRAVPDGPDLRLYRRRHWGRLATMHMLDTRQYRSDQVCGSGPRVCAQADDPARTMTGTAQEKWLLDGFANSTRRWDLIGQQVFFSQRDTDPDPDRTALLMEGWDGYRASRRRVTRGWVNARVRNPIVLTGDVHACWASDIRTDFNDPTTPVVGSEFVTTSITSGGDGYDSPSGRHPWFDQNPHLKFWTGLRGYINARITPTTFTADYRCVPYIKSPGAAVFTRASFDVYDRQRGLVQTSGFPTGARVATPGSVRQAPDARQIIRDTYELES